MASCVRNTCIKNYQNLIIVFQVTVKNVGDVFLRHSVELNVACFYKKAQLSLGKTRYSLYNFLLHY